MYSRFRITIKTSENFSSTSTMINKFCCVSYLLLNKTACIYDYKVDVKYIQTKCWHETAPIVIEPEYITVVNML